MKFENILLVHSEKKNGPHLKTVEEVEKILGKRIKRKICVGKFIQSDLEGVDLVIVVGGDGSFLRVSHYINDEFILGINSESDKSEGGLLSIKEDDLGDLLEILERKNFEEWDRIEAVLNGMKIKELALNEVYIGARNQFYTSRYDICLGDKKESQKSSGALIVTPTGSSAWYKSAGGEKFSHGLKYLIREPFIARLSKSKLIHGEIDDFISFKSTMRGEGVLVIDSNRVYPFDLGDMVFLRLGKKLKVIVK